MPQNASNAAAPPPRPDDVSANVSPEEPQVDDLLDICSDEDNSLEIMGLSMSREQTRLLSSHTPAAEKTAAIEASGDYFESDFDQQDLPSPWHPQPRNFHFSDAFSNDGTADVPGVVSQPDSLDDDLQWEHVRQQVNSRSKAIKDSLQDSGIRMPSLRTLIKSSEHEGTSHFDEALGLLTGDVVVLGGYRGSILRSAQPPHRQLWVPVKVGLNIRKVNLEVGLRPEDEETVAESVRAGEMLSHIGPVDLGRRLLRRLRQCKNAAAGQLRVHEFGYDWRLSPHLLSQRLLNFLDRLPGQTWVIAHSMGGLITRHVVNQRPDLFAGVLYAGVPQHCINILGPMRHGDEVLLSSRVLTAQTNFSFRSSYLLLPDDGHCFVNKHTKEEYPVDFFDPDVWQEYAFSPVVGDVQAVALKKGILGSLSLPLNPSRLANAFTSAPPGDQAAAEATGPSTMGSIAENVTTTIPRSDAMKYLRRTLAQVKTFRAELAHVEAHENANRYPPLAILFASNTPTVTAARVDSRDAIKHANAYDDLAFASGDGVVLARAAMLPPGYRSAPGGRIKSERGHVGLLGDLEGVGRGLVAIINARRAGVGQGL